jgi:Ulp1 family protease
MLGTEIEAYFKSHPILKKHFLGIFAVDQIARINFRHKKFAVVNTDSLSGEGIHWFLIFRSQTETECFDSLGVSKEEVQKRLGNMRNIFFNSSAVQPSTSVNCGVYVIYFALARMLNCDETFEEAEC